MDDLDTLIRLTRLELDEKRKNLAACESVITQILSEQARLRAEIVSETEADTNRMEGGLTHGPFVMATLRKIEQLGEALKTAEQQRDAAREDLQRVFEEAKRFEIAKDLRIAAAEKLAARRETKMFDEIGAESARRKRDEK